MVGELVRVMACCIDRWELRGVVDMVVIWSRCQIIEVLFIVRKLHLGLIVTSPRSMQ